MNSVRFSCTSLAGTNKVGNLKKDADGYYTCVVGALNMYNSAGQYYVYEQAKSLFESSSQLMRRVKRGALRGEYGHPKMQVGQTERQFATRVLSIHEENVCCHHAELTLDFDSLRDDSGRPVVAIISKVAPCGPMGHILERSLNNPKENVCFSIRSFTDDNFRNNRIERTVKTLVTFDYVNEPGMSVAEKFKSPALENFEDIVIARGDIERGIMQLQNNQGMGMESALLTADELFTSMGWAADRGVMQKLKSAPWSGW